MLSELGVKPARCAPAPQALFGAAGEENFAGWPPNASFPYVFYPLGGGPKSQKDAEFREKHDGPLYYLYYLANTA